jgi:penicillin amidase
VQITTGPSRGALAADGGALLANDMHLLVRVPNTWYRAAFRVAGSAVTFLTRIVSTGSRCPGVPALVVGSNTHVAWGFTNSQADWNDLIVLELDPQNHIRYKTPDGWRAFERYDEAIEIAGGQSRASNGVVDDLGSRHRPRSQGAAPRAPMGGA